MKIGMCLICTRKYVVYLRSIIKDVQTYFFTEDDVQIYLFTDTIHEDLDGVIQIEIPSFGFPDATLLRFDMFNKAKAQFHEDYLYYMDVDMNIVDHIGREALPDDTELVGVHHGCCWTAGGTWEENPALRAYTPPERRIIYYVGGVYGGTQEAFLLMAEDLAADVDYDLKQGLMARWHDESYLNRYFSERPVTILPPTYCFPPDPAKELHMFTSPKVVCIIKDHKKMRS